MSLFLTNSGASLVLASGGIPKLLSDWDQWFPSGVNYSFSTTGWTSFGFAAPEGAVPAGQGIQVGALTTQTDVKNAWPDGSLKFAVVTAKITSATTYELRPITNPGGTYSPTWPTGSVDFVISGTTYTATLPAASGTTWLSGSCCKEQKVLVTPKTSGDVNHPFLQVAFFVRAFNDGTWRVQIRVQSLRDSADMNAVTYNLTVTLNGSEVYTESNVLQPSHTAWSKTFWINASEAVPTFDFAPHRASKLMPTYDSNGLKDHTYTTTGTPWDSVVGFGPNHLPMADGGARPDIGLIPAWAAQYFTFQGASQRTTLLGCAEHALWSVCPLDTDGETLIFLTDGARANFWWDARGDAAPSRPLCPVVNNSFRGEQDSLDATNKYDRTGEHTPSVFYPAYLITGDMNWLEMLQIWAVTAETAGSPRTGYTRDGINVARTQSGHVGIIDFEGVGTSRAYAWQLKEVGMAAVMTPDSQTVNKAYFDELVASNLWWLDYYAGAANTSNALGTWGWEGDGELSNNTHVSISDGRQLLLSGQFHAGFCVATLMWWHQNGLTSSGLTALLDRLAGAAVILANSSPTYPRDDYEVATYYIAVGYRTADPDRDPVFVSLADLYSFNVTHNAERGMQSTVTYNSYYVGYLLLSARAAAARGIAGASDAVTFLLNHPKCESGLTVLQESKLSVGTPHAASQLFT